MVVLFLFLVSGAGAASLSDLLEVQKEESLRHGTEGRDVMTSNESREGFDPIALTMLRSNQLQMDSDGIMVGVSREALEMAINYIAREVDPVTEQFPHSYIGRFTFAQWEEFAKKDHCLIDMVPSELRQILAFARKMQECAQFWRDEISADKRESNVLRAI